MGSLRPADRSAIALVREFQEGLHSAVTADVSAEIHELTEEG